MNSDIMAAVIQRYGTHIAGGEYELFVPNIDTTNIARGSSVRSIVDVRRGGIVFRLSLVPIIVDVQAKVTDLDGNAVRPKPPVVPPEVPPDAPLTTNPPMQTIVDAPTPNSL